MSNRVIFLLAETVDLLTHSVSLIALVLFPSYDVGMKPIHTETGSVVVL